MNDFNAYGNRMLDLNLPSGIWQTQNKQNKNTLTALTSLNFYLERSYCVYLSIITKMHVIVIYNQKDYRLLLV